jgi:hypothetical protein
MDIFALIAALLDGALSFSGGRVTVKDRYEMKKKVRELKLRELARRQRADHPAPYPPAAHPGWGPDGMP